MENLLEEFLLCGRAIVRFFFVLRRSETPERVVSVVSRCETRHHMSGCEAFLREQSRLSACRVWMLASLENARDIEGGAGGTETLLRNEVGRKSHGGTQQAGIRVSRSLLSQHSRYV